MLHFYTKYLKNVKNVKKPLRFYDKYLDKHKKTSNLGHFQKADPPKSSIRQKFLPEISARIIEYSEEISAKIWGSSEISSGTL